MDEKLIVKGFEENGYIPMIYTCEGDDVSPEMKIENFDQKKYYMIILNDPDAPVGLFTHWIIYNIKAESGIIKRDIEKISITSEGFYQGKNDFGKIGYGGPCPPKGDKPHRYMFNLFEQSAFINEKLNVKDAYSLSGKFKKLSVYTGLYQRE